MIYSADTSNTTRLRTLQSSFSLTATPSLSSSSSNITSSSTTATIVTTAFVTNHSNSNLTIQTVAKENLHNHNWRGGSEMAKRAEIKPLLSSPTHEVHYSNHIDLDMSDSHNKASTSSSNSDSIHLDITDCNDTVPKHHIHHQVNENHQGLLEVESIHSNESSSLLMAEHQHRLPSSSSATVTRTQVQNPIVLNFMAFLFVSINMIFNLFVISIIHERVPMNESHLPDIAFDILPDHRSFLDITEYVIVIQTTCLFVLLFFHKYRSVILRRICIIMGIIYFFRAICMASTQVPLASKNYICSPQMKNSSDSANITTLQYIEIILSRVFYMSLGMGLSINGHHTYCGDYIFSGHTVILVLVYLTFQEYFLPPRRRTLLWKMIKLSLFLITIGSVICILIARGHYLIDIVIAYFVTSRVFWMYHTLCNYNSSNLRSTGNYLNRAWWWPIFAYFENVKQPNMGSNFVVQAKAEDLNQIQRIFEWPLPWPKPFIQIRRNKHRNEFDA